MPLVVLLVLVDLNPLRPRPTFHLLFICLFLFCFFFCRSWQGRAVLYRQETPLLLLLLSALTSHNLTQCLAISWDRTTSLRPLTHGM